jgi:ketosteroid isomerase-like protein
MFSSMLPLPLNSTGKVTGLLCPISSRAETAAKSYFPVMKNVFLFLVFAWSATGLLHAQLSLPTDKQRKDIGSLIAAYGKARENRDTVLLKSLLTEDMDQLVSSGEWRNGIDEAVQGMLRSSTEAPGTRTLTIEKLRLLTINSAVVDCRYTIQNANGTLRQMWSSFIVVAKKRMWKIAAIRNMLPAQPS